MTDQNFKINEKKLVSDVGDICKIDIRDFSFELISSHSDYIYKIKIKDSDKRESVLILKEIWYEYEFDFYSDILKPLRLNSPQIYGIFKNNGRLFLIIEYIKHTDIDGTKENIYELAIQWLINKDEAINDNFHYISKLNYINKELHSPNICLDQIYEGVVSKEHPLLTDRFFKVIKSRFEKFTTIMNDGRQTLCHNDYRLNNLLYVNHPLGNTIYVIDWTLPQISTVCIDLATIVNSSPFQIRPALLSKYRRHIDFDGFDEIYKCALDYAKINELSWMVKSITNGKNDIDYDRFNFLLTDFQDI